MGEKGAKEQTEAKEQEEESAGLVIKRQALDSGATREASAADGRPKHIARSIISSSFLSSLLLVMPHANAPDIHTCVCLCMYFTSLLPPPLYSSSSSRPTARVCLLKRVIK